MLASQCIQPGETFDNSNDGMHFVSQSAVCISETKKAKKQTVSTSVYNS